MGLPLNLPGREWGRGGGVYINYRAEETHISVVAGGYTTNIGAESIALNTAATELLGNLNKTHTKVVFFSDAL